MGSPLPPLSFLLGASWEKEGTNSNLTGTFLPVLSRQEAAAVKTTQHRNCQRGRETEGAGTREIFISLGQSSGTQEETPNFTAYYSSLLPAVGTWGAALQ